jgi:DNA-binding LacI/PurR family transcriptional regulator
MANIKNNGTTAKLIRHYIYGIIRKNSNVSVKIPSSYKLAEQFSTTRRVAQYELERLIAQGVLISKKRIGTYTNPRSNYSQHITLDDHMSLIGVIYGYGDHFTYAAPAALTLSALYAELSEANCYIHDLRMPTQPESAMIRDISSPQLDGLIWGGFNRACSASLLEMLHNLDIPMVMLDSDYPEFSRVETVYRDTTQHLSRLFTEEKRKLFFSLGTHSSVDRFVDKLAQAMDLSTNNCIHFTSGKLRESLDLMIAALDQGVVPDVVVCTAGLAKAASAELTRYGIDTLRQCRVVSFGEVNRQRDFTGIIVQPNAKGRAHAAVELLHKMIEHQDKTIRKCEVESELIYMNLPTEEPEKKVKQCMDEVFCQ